MQSCNACNVPRCRGMRRIPDHGASHSSTVINIVTQCIYHSQRRPPPLIVTFRSRRHISCTPPTLAFKWMARRVGGCISPLHLQWRPLPTPNPAQIPPPAAPSRPPRTTTKNPAALTPTTPPLFLNSTPMTKPTAPATKATKKKMPVVPPPPQPSPPLPSMTTKKKKKKKLNRARQGRRKRTGCSGKLVWLQDILEGSKERDSFMPALLFS